MPIICVPTIFCHITVKWKTRWIWFRYLLFYAANHKSPIYTWFKLYLHFVLYIYNIEVKWNSKHVSFNSYVINVPGFEHRKNKTKKRSLAWEEISYNISTTNCIPLMATTGSTKLVYTGTQLPQARILQPATDWAPANLILAPIPTSTRGEQNGAPTLVPAENNSDIPNLWTLRSGQMCIACHNSTMLSYSVMHIKFPLVGVFARVCILILFNTRWFVSLRD